ncbi:helix-turn-helix domain-containing protein [Halobaculum litoreum]|uniref:helix-turn-helix domain-containing protein n=1 Tax=Halobaculum litoreum TaxID=3031998 RepID=UPI0024C2CB0D|nr:helix-turn-helix domain-containing protein [Halobaculum sp. DT92]
MPRATLVVDLGPESWIGSLSRSYPGTVFRLLAAIPLTDADGSGLFSVAAEDGGDLDAVVRDLRGHATVRDVEVLRAGDGERLVAFDTSEPFLQEALRNAGVPFEPPVTVRGGEATLSVTTPADRLSSLGDALRAAGYGFRVAAVHQRIDGASVLTDRQSTVVARAVEAGYYDTPRECTLSGLAEELDRAKSTVSETLHRAESNLAKRYVSDRSALAGLGTAGGRGGE